MRQHIPNAVTCANLFSGCMGIYFSMNNRLDYAAFMIAIAAVFDFFDGFIARLLHVKSDLGVQLDSLADMVSFGVLPGMILFQLMHSVLPEGIPFFLTFSAFLVPVFSAIRLAKFNIDTRQTEYFIGLNTPANALLIGSLPLILIQVEGTTMSFLNSVIQNYWVLLFLAVLQSCLLVANLPIFSLKFKDFSWANNRVRYLFLGASVLLLFVFQYVAIPVIIALYILLSLLFFKPQTQK